MATTVAQAAPPYQHMRCSGSDSFTNTICGLDVTIDTEFHGVFAIRTVKDSGGQPGGVQISEEVLAVHGPHANESTFCSTFLGQLT